MLVAKGWLPHIRKCSASREKELAIMNKIGLYSEDPTLFSLLSSALGREFQVKLEANEESMSNLVSINGCNVMILDLNSNSHCLPERIESVSRLIESSIPSVIMCDDAVRSTADDLVRRGAFGYCGRPPSIRDLKTILGRAFENSVLKEQLRAAQGKLAEPASCDRLIGFSHQMQQVYKLIRRVKDVNASVLVTGESGTGKELIARAIHNLSSRASRPFVAVSCGAIPETLVEAELFGHERGAFTGTVGVREGYFQTANDGTLFLDEIGDLSLPTQVKLLRVLQEMEFSRLGSSRILPLRARIIFATNRNLTKMINEGAFRQDLFYRINVLQIVAPALRDRPEDVPLIARHFVIKYSEMFRKSRMTIEPDAMDFLQGHPWPGNVRELENVVQRAIISSSGSSLRIEDLVLATQDDEEPDSENVVSIDECNIPCTFERQLRDYKVKLALTAIHEHDGNKTLAARSLGISRAYLHRLIRLNEPDPLSGQDVHETMPTFAQK